MPPRKTPPGPDTPVEELWNLSRTTGAWLRELGIGSHADLERADLLETWLSLKTRHAQVTKLMYYALWGARENRHWREIPAEEKARVEAVVRSVRARGPKRH